VSTHDIVFEAHHLVLIDQVGCPSCFHFACSSSLLFAEEAWRVPRRMPAHRARMPQCNEDSR
jgi:hypothetical protein